jgi:DGQHR domain-containing protein
MLGLAKSKNIDDFVLPVVFVLDATDEQMGLIFAIINGKQTRVSGSVIYDLFNVVEGRNPFKTCHEIARALNSDLDSPFYRRLKMLGKKIKGSNETLSQGTFITQLLRNITNNPSEDFNRSRSELPPIDRPNCILNHYYRENKDDVILKILLNLFSAIKEVFPDEWENPTDFNLSKTTGYTGIMKAFPDIVKYGLEVKKLSTDYFKIIFNQLKLDFQEESINFTSPTFPPNNTGESKLRDKILTTFNALKSQKKI